MNDKIQLSLTDFVDFVSKTGSSKLTQVKKVKSRDAYHPAQDFYKALREGIIDIHSKNKQKNELNKILASITDTKKVKSYRSVVAGYKKFWGRKNIEWFEPPFKHWVNDDIDVRINPELGLSINNEHYVVKLYLKGEKLSKAKIDQILTLLESELRSELPAEVKVAVLDVQQGKLYPKSDNNMSLLPLLMGEAKSFEIMWKQLI